MEFVFPFDLAPLKRDFFSLLVAPDYEEAVTCLRYAGETGDLGRC